MSHYLIQQIENNPKITVRTCTEVVDTCGEDGHLTGLWLQNRQTGRAREGRLRADVLFHRRRARAPSGSTASWPSTTTASSWPVPT